jgi:Caspase domain
MAFLFSFALLATMIDEARAEKRVALVFGNSAYQHAAELKNPRNDADDVAAVLRRLGFEVIAGLDVDDRQMTQKVRDFARALDGADVALFYYAGHGLQAKGQNYLLPVTAAPKTETDLDFEAVSLDLIMKQMQRMARVNLVILDACRDNPLARSLKASSRSAAIGQGLARVEDTAGMLIAFSTQPGNVALDGTGRNSPFTKALLTHIEAPGATISDIMIEVRKQVMAETAERQVPWENSSLTGKFYFRPGAQVAAVPPAGGPRESIGVSDAALDHTFWTSVAQSNDPALYREYLRRFPGGTYASIADAKLQALLQPRPAAPPEEARSLENPRQVAEEMQRELKRIGCYTGQVDGVWGPAAKRGVERFNQATKLNLQADPPNGQGVTKVKGFTGAICQAEPQSQQVRKVDKGNTQPKSSQQQQMDPAAAGIVGGIIGGYIGSRIRK